MDFGFNKSTKIARYKLDGLWFQEAFMEGNCQPIFKNIFSLFFPLKNGFLFKRFPNNKFQKTINRTSFSKKYFTKLNLKVVTK